jgi:hypothetical protein
MELREKFESKVQGNNNVENAKLLQLGEKKREALAKLLRAGAFLGAGELSELTFNGCLSLPCLVPEQTLAIREVA